METAEAVYQRLIAPIETKMIGIVGRIVRDPDDAADVMQEVLAVVWKKLIRIDRHENPQAYILRICISRSYDYLRKRIRRQKNEVAVDQQSMDQQAAKSTDVSSKEETKALICSALGKLPAKQGQTILLRIFEDISYESIAKILGCSEATARSHFNKGKQKLGRMFIQMGVIESSGAKL